MGKIPPAGQGPPGPRDPIGKDGRKPARSKRRSKFFRRRVASDACTLAKIDLQGPSLITTQAEIKDREEDRRFARIVDIAKMLEDNGALSNAEKQWLTELGHNDYESYCKLGKLLSVPKFWRLSESRVKKRADRNKIRMQTLKAAVFEAVQTADSDTTAEDKKRTIDRALEKATSVRWSLNQRFPRYADGLRRAMHLMHPGQTELHSAMTQKFGGNREIKVYELVTKNTLRDPLILYRPYSRNIANRQLFDAVGPGGVIDGEINKRHVAKAVNALVRNNLLDQRAATDLLDALQNMPDTVNALMSNADMNVRRQADREKVKSLMLLALAYELPLDEASCRRLENKIKVLMTHWRSGRKMPNAQSKKAAAKRDVDDQLEVRRGYKWLPDFPYSKDLSELDHKRLLLWARTGRIQMAPVVVENEVKKEAEADIPLYEADPLPPTDDDDEATPPPPMNNEYEITAAPTYLNKGRAPKEEEPLINGRPIEEWILEDMPIEDWLLEAAEEQGGIEREDKIPDSDDQKIP